MLWMLYRFRKSGVDDLAHSAFCNSIGNCISYIEIDTFLFLIKFFIFTYKPKDSSG